MRQYNNRAPEEIKQIIKKEITFDKTIGFLKNDYLLYMDVEKNPIIDNCSGYVGLAFLLSCPLTLFLTKFDPKSYFIYIPLFPFFGMLLCLFLTYLSKHYLVFDTNKGLFYTETYLFNFIYLPFLTTKFIDSYNIQSLVLETRVVKTKTTKNFIDTIKLLTNDKEEKILAEHLPVGYYHNILIKRCNLLSRCLDVELHITGDRYEIQKIIEFYNSDRKFDPIRLVVLPIIIIILIIVIIYECVYF